MDIRLHNSWTVGGSTRQWCPKINGRPSIFVQTFLRNYIDKNESLSLWEWKVGEKNAMYSATIDLVAECQKWLRNVAYVKTDGQTDRQTDRRTTDKSVLEKLRCLSAGGAKKGTMSFFDWPLGSPIRSLLAPNSHTKLTWGAIRSSWESVAQNHSSSLQYLVIICPNSHETLAKYEIRSSLFAPVWFHPPLFGSNIQFLVT